MAIMQIGIPSFDIDSKSISNVNLDFEQNLVIIGANGSGKTRFGTLIFRHFINDAERISAQRNVIFSDSVEPASPLNAINQVISMRGNMPAHNYVQSDFHQLLVLLFSQKIAVANQYYEDSRKSEQKIAPPETNLDIIINIWTKVLPSRKLTIGSGLSTGQIRVRIDENNEYAPSELSDGERHIFYLIGKAVCANQNCVIIVDEPEIHIHKSIMSMLWDEIELNRPDCHFVYLTHDLDFAVSRKNLKKIWLKQYHKENGQESWEWQEVPQNDEIPEELFLEVLGSRKPILFVEGKNGSWDSIYKRIYPDYTIVYCESCEIVINATASFSNHKPLHNLDCFGVIDRDFRSEEEILYLPKNVFALSYCQVENVFLEEKILGEIALSLNFDETNFPQLLSNFKEYLLNNLSNDADLITSRITSHKIERILKSFDGKVKDKNSLLTKTETIKNNLDAETIYNKVKLKIEKNNY